MILCSHLPLSVGGIYDLLLFNGIWQKQWMDMIMWVWLCKMAILSCEEILSPLLALKKQAAMLYTAHEGSHMARNLSADDDQQTMRNRPLVEQPTRNCMLPTITGARKQIFPYLNLR